MTPEHSLHVFQFHKNVDECFCPQFKNDNTQQLNGDHDKQSHASNNTITSDEENEKSSDSDGEHEPLNKEEDQKVFDKIKKDIENAKKEEEKEEPLEEIQVLGFLSKPANWDEAEKHGLSK